MTPKWYVYILSSLRVIVRWSDYPGKLKAGRGSELVLVMVLVMVKNNQLGRSCPRDRGSFAGADDPLGSFHVVADRVTVVLEAVDGGGCGVGF